MPKFVARKPEKEVISMRIDSDLLKHIDTPNALMNRIGQWALDVQCNGLLTTRYFNERDEAARETTQEQGTSTVRRVNLEDVFLSITGRKVSGSAQ